MNIKKYNSKFDLLFRIFYNSNHIGNIKLGPIKFNNKVSDISLLINEKKYIGHGVMKKLLITLSIFSFHKLTREKVTASCYSNKLGSKAINKVLF